MDNPVVWTPVLIFALVTTIGLCLASLLGIKNPVALAAIGFPLASPVLVPLTLYREALGGPPVITLILLVASVALIVLLGRSGRFTVVIPAAIINGASLLVAWSVWWVLGVAMVNPDSAQIIALSAESIRQGNIPEELKRGLLYPVLLSQGDGDFLAFPVTHFLALNLVLITHALVMRFGLPSSQKSWKAITVYASVSIIFLSTPIVQYLFIYINTHALLALLIGAMLYVLLTIRTTGYETSHIYLLALLLTGATLVRVEGLFVGMVLIIAFLFDMTLTGWLTRSALSVMILMPTIVFGVWILESGSSQLPVSQDGFVALLATAAGASFLVVLPALDRVRPYITGLVAVVTVVVIGWAIAIDVRGFEWAFWAQARNFALGAGGWGFTLLFVLFAGLLLTGRHSSTTTKRLTQAIFLPVLMTLALKVFDDFLGSFGQMGFNDSINRSFLHWIPLFVLLLVRAFSESPVLNSSGRRQHKRPTSGPRAAHLENPSLPTSSHRGDGDS